jgi:cytochrome c peroxidase
MLREVAKNEKGIADACAPGNAAAVFDLIGLSIAIYETSSRAQPFASRYGRFLAGKIRLSEREKRGLALFAGKEKSSGCHPHVSGPKGVAPLFTDFTYDNIGVPTNPVNPFYRMGPEYNPDGAARKDPGLAGFLKTEPRYTRYAAENFGKFKAATLRNVARRPSPGFVKAYGHNGVFKSSRRSSTSTTRATSFPSAAPSTHRSRERTAGRLRRSRATSSARRPGSSV